MSSRDRIISGIDIGTSKITTLVSTIGEEGAVRVIGVSTVPSRGLKKGQIVNIEEATAAISQSLEAAERMAGVQVASAYLSVGGAHIASMNSHGVVAVTEPEKEITNSDVKRVIESAKAISLPSSREIMHIIPRGFIVDGQDGIVDPVNMTGVRLEVDTHMITGGTIAIRNLFKCVEELGVEVSGTVFSGLASSLATLSDTEKELGVILVDIGGGTTDVAIYVDSALSYSSVIPIGAFNITKDVAAGLKISIESAEKIKMKAGEPIKAPVMPEEDTYGKPPKPDKSDEIDVTGLFLPEGMRSVSRKVLIEGIMKPRLNEIFAWVATKIKESGFGGMTPSGIVLTGGGAMTAAAVEAARRSLAMPVRIGTPNRLTGLIDEITTPAYTTSAGLLLYGATSQKHEESALFSGIGKVRDRIQVKGAAGRLIDLVKSILP